MVVRDASAVQPQSENFTASTARSGGFLAVPLKAIRDHGQAAQALAGILAALRQDGKKTFRNQAALAKNALLPERTFRRHLSELERVGLVESARAVNVTNVTRVTADEADLMADGFLAIPRWTAERLNWSERIVYAWIVYRAELSLDQSTCEDSCGKVAKSLGITKRSVHNALAGLVAKQLIERSADLPGETGTSRLIPPGEPESTTSVGSEKVADTPVKKWPPGSEKVAAPSTKKLLKETGQKKSADQIFVEQGEIETVAVNLFRKAGYSGADGGFLWKLAAMLHLGLVSDHEANSCTQGAKECGASNRPAYARTILRKSLERDGKDLAAIMARIRITPELPTKPPERPQATREALAGIFRRP